MVVKLGSTCLIKYTWILVPGWGGGGGQALRAQEGDSKGEAQFRPRPDEDQRGRPPGLQHVPEVQQNRRTHLRQHGGRQHGGVRRGGTVGQRRTGEIKLCSLTKLDPVDFSQSRISVKKCVFNKRTIKVCVSYFVDGVLGPPRPPGRVLLPLPISGTNARGEWTVRDRHEKVKKLRSGKIQRNGTKTSNISGRKNKFLPNIFTFTRLLA